MKKYAIIYETTAGGTNNVSIDAAGKAQAEVNLRAKHSDVKNVIHIIKEKDHENKISDKRVSDSTAR